MPPPASSKNPKPEVVSPPLAERHEPLLSQRDSSLVAPPGLEPGRSCEQRILNPARLPFRQGASRFCLRSFDDRAERLGAHLPVDRPDPGRVSVLHPALDGVAAVPLARGPRCGSRVLSETDIPGEPPCRGTPASARSRYSDPPFITKIPMRPTAERPRDEVKKQGREVSGEWPACSAHLRSSEDSEV